MSSSSSSKASGPGQSRNRPTPREWQAIKAEFEELYLVQNMTAGSVKHHFDQRGFNASVRQYKIKLKKWGFDCKKIRGHIWGAMYAVQVARSAAGDNTVFTVPIRNGSVRRINSDLIKKQMRRNNLPAQSLELALETLAKEGVGILSPDINVIVPPNQHVTAETAISSSVPNKMSCHNIAISPSATSAVTSLIPSSPSVPTQSTSSGIPSQANTLPPIHDLLDVARRDYPTSQSQQHTAVCEAERKHHSETEGLEEVNDYDLISAFGQLQVDSFCDKEMWQDLQQCIGQADDIEHPEHLDEDKRLATQWAAYYVLLCLPRKKGRPGPPADQRKAAMQSFRAMLSSHSRYIYPNCNAVLAILGASGQKDLPTRFLSDCCAIIDENLARHDSWYSSPFHLALAMYERDQYTIQQCIKNLEASDRSFRMIWTENSPNYLVIQCHIGWHKLDQRHYDEALKIFWVCLPHSERVMGREHPNTINCLAMISRAYAENGDPNRAIGYLGDALQRMYHTPKIMQAYRDRLLRRLAELQELTNDTVLAEENLHRIIGFRTSHFGITHELTWKAIEQLVGIYIKTGQRAKADALQADMTYKFDRQKQQDYEETYLEPAPWWCSNCHQKKQSRLCCSNFPRSSARR